MNYKLAKELEKAGLKLPIDKHRKQWRVNWEVKKSGKVEEAILVVGENYESKGNCDEGACGSYLINIPTLSELIEACGDGFEKLVRQKLDEEGLKLQEEITDGVCKGNWVAWSYQFSRFGESPEEAVAKLFIALNKK